MRVSARRGYWAASEKELTEAETAAATPVNVGLRTALSALLDSVNTRPVALWTGFAKGEAERTRVSFTWEINAEQGAGNRDQGVGTREQGAGTREQGAGIREQGLGNRQSGAAKPARLEIQPIDDAGKETAPAQVIGGAPGELPMVARFEFPGGKQRLRFTALSKSGDLLDRWVLTQQVPDLSKAQLVLSTPKLLRARNMIEWRALESNAEPSATAATKFSATDRVLVDIECAAPAGEAADHTIDLLNAQGDVLRALEAPPLADGHARLQVPVASLANSTYVLRIEARAGEHRAQQWIAFRVQR